MRVLFDTSVLIASMTKRHPKYNSAHACFIKYVGDDDAQICVSTHTLAETYRVLTATPLWNISAAQARNAIESLRPHLMVITLDEGDYIWALDRVSSLGLVSGSIYDCLHARAALKAEVATLYTDNIKHFVRFGEDVRVLVKGL